MKYDMNTAYTIVSILRKGKFFEIHELYMKFDFYSVILTNLNEI
jgi:hypothetical protein